MLQNKIKYYKGETIGFYVGEDANINLDEMDFKVSFTNPNSPDIDFLKTDLTRVDVNKYYGEILNGITYGMREGEWSIEIFAGDDYTVIEKAFAFCLQDTKSKKFVLQ